MCSRLAVDLIVVELVATCRSAGCEMNMRENTEVPVKLGPSAAVSI